METDSGGTAAGAQPGPPARGIGAGLRPRVRRGFPLRVHIAALFVALVTGAGLAIVVYGYIATSRLQLAAGDEEFLYVADRTAAHVRSLLAPAHLLVQLFARHRLTATTDLDERLQTLPLVAAALAEHPEISAMYVGFGSGDFFLVRSLSEATRRGLQAPPDAAFLVQSRASSPGAARGRYLFFDAGLHALQDTPRPDYDFDPRTREWFQQALSSAGTVRTAPYVFFTTREIGTTLAQRSADGGSVVGVDITLQDLSRRLAQSRVTPSARMALVDGRGLVVADADAERLIRLAPGGGPAVTRLDDLGDAALSALSSAGVPAAVGTRLEVAGRPWIGMKRSIAADAGDPLLLLIAAPRAELVAEARGLAQRQVLIGLGVLALTLGLVWMFARRISRPLEALARSVEKIGRGDLEAPLPGFQDPLEVGSLIDVTDRMRGQLKGHIEERAARLADEQRRARELEIARQIQQSMLPAPLRAPLDDRYAIAAALQPAREVGGDLYDFMVDGPRLLFAIGDVADKGIPAALLMARVTGLFRVLGRGGAAPDDILMELDSRLSEGNDACMFVTAACGQLDGESGEVRYASAGHERPLLRRLDGTTTVLAQEGGPALGLGLQGPFPVWSIHLAPGDALILCTDGVTETFDARGHAFGLDGLRSVVAATPADALAALPTRLVEALEDFSVGAGPRDDLAVLAVQYRPAEVEMGSAGGEWWRLPVGSDHDEIGRAARWTEVILTARQIPAATVQECVRAVRQELARHLAAASNGGDAGGRVELRLPDGDVEIRVEGAGPPAGHPDGRGGHAWPGTATIVTVHREPGASSRPAAASRA